MLGFVADPVAGLVLDAGGRFVFEVARARADARANAGPRARLPGRVERLSVVGVLSVGVGPEEVVARVDVGVLEVAAEVEAER